MLEAYSVNIAVDANAAIPFNNVNLEKCADAELLGNATIQLNRCGVYKVSCNGTAQAAADIQLYKDGVAQLQAQSTGTNVHFDTLVQVPRSNCNCPCVSPTKLQVMLGDTAATFDIVDIVVTRVLN